MWSHSAALLLNKQLAQIYASLRLIHIWFRRITAYTTHSVLNQGNAQYITFFDNLIKATCEVINRNILLYDAVCISAASKNMRFLLMKYIAISMIHHGITWYWIHLQWQIYIACFNSHYSWQLENYSKCELLFHQAPWHNSIFTNRAFDMVIFNVCWIFPSISHHISTNLKVYLM